MVIRLNLVLYHLNIVKHMLQKLFRLQNFIPKSFMKSSMTQPASNRGMISLRLLFLKGLKKQIIIL